MKLYQITLEVPDNFIPEDMELNIIHNDEIKIHSEGFVSEDCEEESDSEKAN